MKKSVLIILLLLAACGPQVAETPEPSDFRFGTEGLALKFVPNLPPPEMFSPALFNAVVEIENRGTHPVGPPRSTIYLSGFDTSIITGMPTTGLSIPLVEGRGPFVRQGGIDSVSFQGNVVDIGMRRIDKYEPTILATACYEYQTIASGEVCIDPNPFSPTTRNKICTPGSVSLGSQGAPIAVTSVDVEPSPKKTRFKINIQNVGPGQVFNPRSMQNCNPYSTGLRFDEVDVVRLGEVRVANMPIHATCKPVDNYGFVRLTDGQATIYCELSQLIGQNPYTSPITIILEYGYRQSISQRIQIRATRT